MIGVLDSVAVEALDRVAQAAERDAHVLTLDLTHLTTITANARDALIIRGFCPEGETPGPRSPRRVVPW